MTDRFNIRCSICGATVYRHGEHAFASAEGDTAYHREVVAKEASLRARVDRSYSLGVLSRGAEDRGGCMEVR